MIYSQIYSLRKYQVMYNPKATYVEQDSDDDQYQNENGAIGSAVVGGFKTIVGPDIRNQNNQNRKVITLAPYDPKNEHRTVYQGMNFQGKCLNSNCKVKNQMVWVGLGYGQFNFAQKVWECLCPICKKELQAQTVTNIGYRLAKVKFIGRKSTGEKVEFSDEERIGKLIKFVGGSEGRSVEWVFLKMQVTKI